MSEITITCLGEHNFSSLDIWSKPIIGKIFFVQTKKNFSAKLCTIYIGIQSNPHFFVATPTKKKLEILQPLKHDIILREMFSSCVFPELYKSALF